MDMQSVIMALVLTGWIAIVAFAALRGWTGWLALKRAELDMAARGRPDGPDTMAGLPAPHRIELADLRERVRKLETIAAGIDL